MKYVMMTVALVVVTACAPKPPAPMAQPMPVAAPMAPAYDASMK